MFYEVIPIRIFRSDSIGILTYSSELPLKPGHIIEIPLGRGKTFGIVTKKVTSVDFPTKPITRLLYDIPLPSHILKSILWLSEYYLTPLPLTAKLFLPPGVGKKRRKGLSEQIGFPGISATTGAGDRRSARDDGPRSRCPENSCLNISLASVMLANNEIGTINDIKSLAKTAHAHGALFHTDATQALGKVKINVKDLDVDYMTISSHKIGGPIGIGALYIKKGSPFTPFIIGGHQERGRRAGTYQTVNIAGFGAAAKYANDHKTWEIYQKKIRPLRDQLRERILKEIPYSSANTPDNSLPNILNCSFEAAEGESIQLYLDAEGDIITSTGSACASGDGKPSHVIMAVRNDAEIAHSSVRFSFGLDSTEKDVDHVMKYLPGIVDRLQKISTLKAGKIKKEDSYYGRK